ncbi:hypothetical protein MWN34_03485 [Ancylobacter sp. 6x-1]|uniref:Uncharacterized protein n=1 Tax=Ancylobacter crimeensis TaxID=2579147 RepID=A0ABT0D7P4_9HYPH|nr:hypothetical protein [Ancylobacter crimeensis]MCK0195968.1 hypothetical protein [Ancylobacter crimeensis]
MNGRDEVRDAERVRDVSGRMDGARGRDREPRVLSEKRARYEAWHARIYRKPLPKGHPYALMPEWVPYPLACLVGRLHAFMPGRR